MHVGWYDDGHTPQGVTMDTGDDGNSPAGRCQWGSSLLTDGGTHR